MTVGSCLTSFECFRLKSRFSLNKTAHVEFALGLRKSDFIYSSRFYGDQLLLLGESFLGLMSRQQLLPQISQKVGSQGVTISVFLGCSQNKKLVSSKLGDSFTLLCVSTLFCSLQIVLSHTDSRDCHVLWFVDRGLAPLIFESAFN